MQITDRYADGTYYGGGIANDALFWFPNRKTNMSKKLKLAVLAAVLAMTGAISSPVLAMNGAISSPVPQHQLAA
jgi:hypothetical protein